MSLGLAISDGKRIYMATESKGINCPRGTPPISSKIIPLQKNPEIKMLVTGGLYHWRDVMNKYVPKTTIEEARDEVIRELEDVTECCNEACALILGYKNGEPICYRINKLEYKKIDFQLGEKPQSLESPQPIGMYMFAEEATEKVKQLLNNGTNKEKAIKQAIEYCIGSEKNTGGLEKPVVVDTMDFGAHNT